MSSKVEAIKEVQRRTGAGLIDAKKAIDACNCDIDAACDLINSGELSKYSSSSSSSSSSNSNSYNSSSGKGSIIGGILLLIAAIVVGVLIWKGLGL